MADGRDLMGTRRICVAIVRVPLVCSVMALGICDLYFAMDSGDNIWILCDLATP